MARGEALFAGSLRSRSTASLCAARSSRPSRRRGRCGPTSIHQHAPMLLALLLLALLLLLTLLLFVHRFSAMRSGALCTISTASLRFGGCRPRRQARPRPRRRRSTPRSGRRRHPRSSGSVALCRSQLPLLRRVLLLLARRQLEATTSPPVPARRSCRQPAARHQRAAAPRTGPGDHHLDQTPLPLLPRIEWPARMRPALRTSRCQQRPPWRPR